MTWASQARAISLRQWAASLESRERRLFLAVARDVLPSLRGEEAADLQRRCDAIRKVTKRLDAANGLPHD